MSEIDKAQQELIDEFQLFDNWMDRYQYIIDMGRKLPPLPAEAQVDANLLKGCQSRVWLVTRNSDGKLEFQAISDSAIVSGLIAILMRVYNRRKPAEILSTPPTFIKAIGLDEHLSPTRSNGLNAMIAAIQHAAEEHAAA